MTSTVSEIMSQKLKRETCLSRWSQLTCLSSCYFICNNSLGLIWKSGGEWDGIPYPQIFLVRSPVSVKNISWWHLFSFSLPHSFLQQILSAFCILDLYSLSYPCSFYFLNFLIFLLLLFSSHLHCLNIMFGKWWYYLGRHLMWEYRWGEGLESVVDLWVLNGTVLSISSSFPLFPHLKHV